MMEIVKMIVLSVVKSKPFIIVFFLLVGLAAGLIYAWQIDPATWTDTDPYDMRQAHQEAYVLMAADSFDISNDVEQARQRFAGWPPQELSALMASLMTKYQEQGPAVEAQRVQQLAEALEVQIGVAATPQPSPTPRSPLGGLSLGSCLIPLAAVGLVLAVVAVFLYLRSRGPSARPEPFVPDRDVLREGEEGIAPLVFESTYNLGDDRFDESFGIEVGGDFWGECGMAASEVIEAGPPEKVTAFEVWIFDKDEIRTVTKVLMSEHAYEDENLRFKLTTKGDVVRAAQGQRMVLETRGLRANVVVTDFAYGSEPGLPPNSHFAGLAVSFMVVKQEPEQPAREL